MATNGADEIYADFVDGFENRKFIAGLLIAIIDFVLELGLPREDVASYQDLVTVFPRRDTTSAGKRANTLIVSVRDRTLSLRPFYNAVERFFRSEKKRYDYPVCAPHATQAWSDYLTWIDRLCRLDMEELRSLRKRVVAHVLEALPSQEFVAGSVELEPPAFRIILEEFDFSPQVGERTGASFQGAVFGFVRADNPHLQVEVDKVRAGSRRLQRVGDVDGWEGERLAITAEVKFRRVGSQERDALSGFVNSVNKRGAIGILVAHSFKDGTREAFSDSGLRLLDIDDLVKIVDLWDPAKQRIAVESMLYFVAHVEKSSALRDRLVEFVRRIRN